MVIYTNAHMTDIHFMYGRANGNSFEARRLYAETFPNRELPSHNMFTRLHQRLREEGSFRKRAYDTGRSRSVSTPEVQEQILLSVEQNPETSVRRISAQVGISAPLVWKTLHEQLLYPYHIQRVQSLQQPDYAARLLFSQWFLRENAERPNFSANILFTDEAGFTRQGIFNFHNNHAWSDENPHAVVEARHQIRFSLNVWMGILGDRLIGPVFLPNRLTGAAYHDFLVNTLPGLLDDVPLNQRAQHWFMHDGAPPHFAVAVREHLNRTFNARWIGRGGPVGWPPRSPDLTPLDYFLWGYLKSLVYATPVDDLDELRQRIEQGCQTIRQIPGILERVRGSFIRRCNACVENDGGHFEHLL